MYKTTVFVPSKCNNSSAVQAKLSELQFTLGYS